MSNCVFCQRILNLEFDESSKECVSFEPLRPVTVGHLLIVPRYHVTDAAQFPKYYAWASEFAANIAKRRRVPFNLITSSGVEATQSVFHLHIHYVPRFHGDGLLLPWSNQK